MRSLARLVLLVTPLAGCTTVPGIPPAPAPRTSLNAEQAFTAREGTWPDDQWWCGFGDPQLDALINEALSGAPNLLAAAARVRKADALAEQAGAVLAPSLVADGSIAEAKQSYNNGPPRFVVPKGFHDNTRIAASASWDPDLWGRNRDALAAATSEADAARADAAQTRLLLTTSLASAYYDLGRAFTDRESAVAAAEIRKHTLDIVRARGANGLETSGIVNQSLAADRSAQSDVVAIDEAIAITRARIAALLGAGPDRGLAIAEPRPVALQQQGIPATIGLDLVARRPDVAARLLRVEANARRVKAARKDFLPNLTLSGFAGLQSLDVKSIAASGSEIASLGLALHLPIFDGGRLRGAYRGQRADFDAAVADYNAALATAFQDVATALATTRTIDTRIQQLENAVAASRKAYAVAQARYEQQLTSYLNVLTAEDSLVAAQRGLNALRARRISADIDLIRALGGGYRNPKTMQPAGSQP